MLSETEFFQIIGESVAREYHMKEEIAAAQKRYADALEQNEILRERISIMEESSCWLDPEVVTPNDGERYIGLFAFQGMIGTFLSLAGSEEEKPIAWMPWPSVPTTNELKRCGISFDVSSVENINTDRKGAGDD